MGFLHDQAEAVNLYQQRAVEGAFHPLTCGKCRPPERDERPLYAVVEGYEIVLYCPLVGSRGEGQCDYRQVMTPRLIETCVEASKISPDWWHKMWGTVEESIEEPSAPLDLSQSAP